DIDTLALLDSQLNWSLYIKFFMVMQLWDKCYINFKEINEIIFQTTHLENNKVNTAKVNSVNTAKGKRVTSAVGEQRINVVKSTACWGDPQVALKDIGIFDNGCSRHMTGNKFLLTDYQDYDGGFVAFACSSKGGNRTNGNAGLETNSDAGQAGKENVPDQEYILLPLLHTSSNVPSNSEKDESSPKDDAGKKNEVKDSAKEGNMNGPGEATNTDSTNRLNTVSSPVNTVSSSFTTVDPGRAKEQRNEYESLFDPLIPDLEDTADLQDTGIFGSAYDDEYVGAEADLSNLETNMSVSPIPTTRIHKDHPKAQIIGEVDSAVQTRRMHKQNEAGLITFINKQRRTNHKDFQNCLFACFLSQMEPKKVTQALDDESWVEAMQEELLQFKLLNVWTLVDLPHGKKAIGTKWVFRNKRDQRGIVVRNKARLMDVKSAFLYGNIEEEVYVNQPLGFVDPEFPNRVYKVEKALYGLHQVPRSWYETLSTYLLENEFRRGSIDKTLFIKKIKHDIILVQVYVDDIIFGSTKESLSTEFEHPLPPLPPPHDVPPHPKHGLQVHCEIE
ncbi:putative ribonuclease H-like domain-containing protein, partial [Tanacetum coccineum]